jgi:hypothetical protein
VLNIEDIKQSISESCFTMPNKNCEMRSAWKTVRAEVAGLCLMGTLSGWIAMGALYKVAAGENYISPMIALSITVAGAVLFARSIRKKLLCPPAPQ